MAFMPELKREAAPRQPADARTRGPSAESDQDGRNVEVDHDGSALGHLVANSRRLSRREFVRFPAASWHS